MSALEVLDLAGTECIFSLVNVNCCYLVILFNERKVSTGYSPVKYDPFGEKGPQNTALVTDCH
jgi:hypothetical protein